MNTIWKFPLLAGDVQRVAMPLGAVILTVQMQNDIPCLWAIVDPEAELEDRTILCMGTGHLRPELDGLIDRVSVDEPRLRYRVVNNGYIGTIQMMGGQLVFHFFEKRA